MGDSGKSVIFTLAVVAVNKIHYCKRGFKYPHQLILTDNIIDDKRLSQAVVILTGTDEVRIVQVIGRVVSPETPTSKETTLLGHGYTYINREPRIAQRTHTCLTVNILSSINEAAAAVSLTTPLVFRHSLISSVGW